MRSGEGSLGSPWSRLKAYLNRNPLPRGMFWAASLNAFLIAPLGYFFIGRTRRFVLAVIAIIALYLFVATPLIRSLEVLDAPYVVLGLYWLPTALKCLAALDVGLLVLLGRARPVPRGWAALRAMLAPCGASLALIVVFGTDLLGGPIASIQKSCIQTQAMEPLLRREECYLVVKLPEYARGDVVKYREGEGSGIYDYGRVIGVPGDVVSFSSGSFSVNGRVFGRTALSGLPDPEGLTYRLNARSRLTRETNSDGMSYEVFDLDGGDKSRSLEGETTVAPQTLFLAGDAREASYWDSRRSGPKPLRLVQGKVVVVLSSSVATRRLKPIKPVAREILFE